MSDSPTIRTRRTRARRAAIAAASAALGLILAATTAVAPAAAAKPVRGGATPTTTVYDCGFFHDRTVTTQKVVIDQVALKAGQAISATVSPARAGDSIFLTSSIGLNITFSGAPATEGFTFTAPLATTYRLSFGLVVPEGSTVPDGLTWRFTCSTGPSAMTGAPMPAPSAPADSDKDGVTDAADLCPSTTIPESVRKTAGKYYAATGGRFVDGAGKVSGVTVIDTAGCNAAQIASKLKLSGKEARGGITLAQLTDWANTH